jgi:hypothetical protein
VQTPIVDLFGRDLGDVDVAVGGPTPCTVATTSCTPKTRRVYVSSLERAPMPLQAHLAYTDNRGASWIINDLAAINQNLIDRPWLAVDPSSVSAAQDKVYVAYHDFSVSQIWVAASTDGGTTFGPSVDVFAADPRAQTSTFCNSIPSGVEVDPSSHDVYVLWITSGLVENEAGGCNITQTENFHDVWAAHSPPAAPGGVTVWDNHEVFNGPPTTNTDEIFATLAVDLAGNVYAVFPDNLQNEFDIWFTHSSDKAQTWTDPVKVNSDKGTHYFPWITAGSAGRVDFIWLNTPDTIPTDAPAQEGGSRWYVTFAQTTNGTSATPKFNQTAASSSVMHVGGICTNGIFCSTNGGNRDLADSISIAIDRGGSAGLVWTDQGTEWHGPTHITYGCVTSQQTAIVGANQGLSCKGPANSK